MMTNTVRLGGTAVLVVALSIGGFGQGPPGNHPLSGRAYAAPMDVGGAPWLDRANREQEENTEKALQVIGIARGSSVADIGAGSGYYTVKLATLVGPSGRVYANDIQPGMLDLVRRKVDQLRLVNVSFVLGESSDPRLPPSSVDLALMVDVYHEVSEPQSMLRHIRDALRPGGRLVLLEYRGEDASVPIQPLHKMTVAQAKVEIEAEGFVLSGVREELPWQHILIFTRR